uniref:Obscurin, cytoskeletal calmodulin and titin-interacting RhoGEF b n=1 Tax=Neogobius melanostomus TaxID=47308 RepID=A0A8C6U3L7_9GOBI
IKEICIPSIMPKTCSMCTGKDATLSCTVVGSPTPLITWEKDKLKLKSGGRFKTLEDGDVYRLTIYELSLEDSGQYMCRAKNNVGEAYAAVTLKVALPAEMAQRAPVFLEKPTSARVGLGGDVVFHCRVAAHPEANFDWEKDGRYLGESNRIKVVSENDLSTLKIQSVRNLDSGTYTCRAQNSVGRAHEEMKKDILPKGVFTRTCTVTEGKHAKLSCLVTGHPKPHIIWRKDGKVLADGKHHHIDIYNDGTCSLVITAITTKDTGVYTCEATNKFGVSSHSAKVSVGTARESSGRRPLTVGYSADSEPDSSSGNGVFSVKNKLQTISTASFPSAMFVYSEVTFDLKRFCEISRLT